MSVFDNPNINGSYVLNSNKIPLYIKEELSVLKIQFSKSDTSFTSYISAKSCILTAEGVKIFAVVFQDTSGNEVTDIQIPLIGQTIDYLVKSINSYSDIVADVVNYSGFTSTLLLKDTAFVDITNKWSYFNSENIDINSSYSSLDVDLRFFLTTPQPISIQKNLTQSLGGFVSLGEIYQGALLLDSLSIYDSSLSINEKEISSDFSLSDFQSSQYLQINDEIIKIDKWIGSKAYISERNSFDTPLRMHSANSVIRKIAKNDFFDNKLSSDRKQYRCLAIKNTNKTDVAKNMKVFLRLYSRNNLSVIRLAIESPISDYYEGVSSSTGLTAFSVIGLIGNFESSHFVASPIVFTSGVNTGQIRIIKSYNPTSGTIELDQRLPFSISSGDSFYIDTAPCQRVKSGTKPPSGDRVSAFFDANREEDAISINIGENRISGNDLLPNEVIYIWIERGISDINDEFINNRFSLSVIYSKI